jgi:hypothetical protein
MRLRFEIGPAGTVLVHGLRLHPVRMYAAELLHLVQAKADLVAFVRANEHVLSSAPAQNNVVSLDYHRLPRNIVA